MSTHRDVRRRSRGAAALLAGLALLTIGPARAQQASLRAYESADGLGNPEVRALFVDRDGLMWAATERGLYRSSGFRFARADAIAPDGDARIADALQDPLGRVWIGTAAGIAVRDTEGHWRNVETNNPAPVIEPGRRMAMRDAFEMLLISHGRLFSLRASQDVGWGIAPTLGHGLVETHPELDRLSTLAIGTGQTLWLGCGTALCLVEGERLQESGPEQGVPADTWKSILVASDGTVWAHGLRHLVRRPPGAERFESVDAPEAAVDAEVPMLDVVEGPAGEIVAAARDGILRWDGARWRYEGLDQGLPRGQTGALAFDHEGTLWLATEAAGLHRWRGWGRWQSWGAAQLAPSPSVQALVRRDAQSVWAGTARGLVAIDPASGAVSRVADSVETPSPGITSLLKTADGAVWAVAARHLLLRYAPGSPSSAAPQRMAELPDLEALADDGVGGLWLGAGRALYRLPVAVPGTALQRATEFPEADGAIRRLLPWAGGLLIVTQRGVWWLKEQKLHRLTPERAGNVDVLSAALSPDGVLWLGTTGGAVQPFEIGDEHLLPRKAPDSGLEGHPVRQLGLDAAGRLWAGSDDGLRLLDPKRGWLRLDRGDGLIWDDCNPGAFLADDEGSVWIGTRAGVSRAAATVAEKRLPLTAFIAQAALGGQTLAAGAPVSGHGALDFAFGSPNYAREGSLRFRYRLRGLDDGWVTTPDPEVHLPALPPGRYTLEAQVEDRATSEQSPPATFEFQIAPPWWRRGWVQLLAALLAIFAGWGAWTFLRARSTKTSGAKMADEDTAPGGGAAPPPGDRPQKS